MEQRRLGRQAKEWLDLVKPQLVLLDDNTHDMQGTELVTYIGHNYMIQILL